jgi:hypothetical protein
VSGRSTDISSFRKIIAISVSATPFETCRGVIATVAGTITGIDADGNAVTAVPVVVGANPYQMKVISAATATGLFLGY